MTSLLRFSPMVTLKTLLNSCPMVVTSVGDRVEIFDLELDSLSLTLPVAIS